jgi:hypothetical protein
MGCRLCLIAISGRIFRSALVLATTDDDTIFVCAAVQTLVAPSRNGRPSLMTTGWLLLGPLVRQSHKIVSRIVIVAAWRSIFRKTLTSGPHSCSGRTTHLHSAPAFELVCVLRAV